MMTSRERVRIAMDGGIPDRVPLMCQLSIGHMLLQLGAVPLDYWHDVHVFADGLVKLRAIYGFDGILVSLHGHDPEWRVGIRSREPSPEGEIVTWANGEQYLYLLDDLPKSLIREAKPPVEEFKLSDLPATLPYIPVSGGLRFAIHPEHTFDIFDLIREKAGEDVSMHGEITSPFDYLLDLFGYEEALMALLTDTEKCQAILDHFAVLVEDLAVRMCATGVDAIKVSSPFAGSGFLSPEQYREFVLPHEGRIARSVRAQGVHIYTHTCGAISDRLEAMLEAGVSGIECLDPPPLGNVELADAFHRFNHRAFIKGNIDSVHTLLMGTNEKILSDAHERISVGKQAGGFILSTACSVAPPVKREKLLLLKEAVEKWGHYDHKT